MTDDSEGLAVAVQANLKDFNRAMGQIEAKIHGMERKMSADMRRIDDNARRAARNMEREFSQMTVGVAGKIRSLRTMTGDARSIFGGMFGALGAIGPGNGVLGVVGGVAGGAALTAITRQTAAIADMRAEADRAGLSFEKFQELEFAFGKQRVSIDALTDGFKELQLRADEFIRTGGGGGAEWFERMGYSADELARKLEDPVELFFEILDRSKQFGRAGQLRLWDEIGGGTGGEQFVQLLAAGSDELRESMRRARELGIVLSDDVADRAQEVNEKFDEMSRVIGNKVRGGLLSLGTLITDLAKETSEWIQAANDFSAGLGRETPGGRLSQIAEELDRIEAVNRELQKGREAAAAATFGNDIDLGISPEDLAAIEGATEAYADQTDEIARAEELLARASEIVQQMEAIGNQLQADAARAQVEALKREIEALKAASGTIRLEPVIVGQSPTLTGNHPTAGLPQPVGGTMGAHGQRLVQIRTASGKSASVNAEHAAKFQGLIDDLEAQGYAIRSLGGYNNRNIAGTNKLSNHAFGNAIDINPAENPMGPNLITDMPANVAELAKKHGLGWGGNWTSKKDAMHFEAESGDESAMQQAADAAARTAEAEATTRAEARARRAEAIEAVNEKLREGIELQQIESDMLKEGKLSHDEINAALEQEREVRAELDALRASGAEVSAAEEEAIRRLIALKYESAAANDALRDADDAQLERIGELKDAFASLGESALDEFFAIIEGSKSAEDAIKGLVKQMAKMALQGALFGSGPLGQFFGGGLLGGFGKRASGGPVSAGHVYQVNEGGTELFVPNQSGRIIDASRTAAALNAAGRPFQKAGGSGGAHITVGWSRSADGNLKPFVESVSRATAGPVAEAAAGRHADNVRSEVPSMVDARNHQRETRRTGTIRSRRGLT